MYAVQNGTEIMFNTVLYISYFHWAGGGYRKGLYRNLTGTAHDLSGTPKQNRVLDGVSK